MKWILTCAMCLLCVGCIPTKLPMPTEEKEQEKRAEVLQKTEDTTAEKQEVAERLLPSGVIEIGERDAPVVLLMFTEHHCRYCKQFFREQFPRLYEDFIEPGTLRLHISIVPLKKYIHSQRSILGLLCAGMQGKAISMHEMLFTLGAKNNEILMKQADTLELDGKLFSQCLESPDTQRTVERQKSLARSLNVTLVPTFFLNGKRSVGLPSYADLRGMIEQEIDDL